MKPKRTLANKPPVIAVQEEGKKSFVQRWGMRALVISVLAHVCFIILAIFVFFRIVGPKPEAPPDFSALGGGGGGSGETAHKIQSQARKASQMSDQSRKIASQSVSDFTLPDPSDSTLNAALPQVEGGAGTGGGSGGGIGTGKGTGIGSGTGPGSGNGRGAFTAGFRNNFFNQPLIGKRAVFVLDYSRSMQVDGRQGILQNELRKVISGIQDGKEFQVILFAGYSWIPGDSVDLAADQMSATVKSGDKTFEWVRPSKTGFEWLALDGGNKHYVRPVTWQAASTDTLNQTMSAIEGTKLQMGTCWEIPLEMALEMKPAPEVIFFMTDGITGDSDAGKIAARITRKAQGTKTVINAISMMEPTDVAPMKELAAKTGGGFSIVQKDGKATVVTKPKATPASEEDGGPGSDLR